ncbi:MAG TPA: Rieske 2Fe-2S domain-containing protein [Acidimicrobiales bacterium]|nr:Rieske 2Fe-2S domain-containing protein [Acidimicrobiales bacterium]
MTIDYTSYVKRDRVHSRIFTDREIFDEEMVRIFESGWNFVGHESEVPEPGDYVTKFIGRQPVIMSRDSAGSLNLLMNRCRHRGTAVCQQERGNANFFRCPYHGWTYGNDGKLVGVPFPSSYGPEFDKDELGLTRVPVIDSYRGFVFASLRPVDQPLTEWLGRTVLDVMDMFVSASPTGRIRVRAGSHKTTFKGNWKYVGMDGYHTNFTHKIVSDLVVRKMPEAGNRFNEMFSDRSPNLTWDLGNGHCRLDTVHAQGEGYARIMAGALQATEGGRAYMASLEEVHGDRAAEVLAKSRDPHLGVWPNLQLIGVQIRVIRPIAPDRTEVTLYPALLEGVPDEINDARLRSHEWFYGPAGFGQPDDGELFERNQIGLMADVDPWLFLARGLSTERHNPDGTIVGNITDETTQRGQMRQWLSQMADGAEPGEWAPEGDAPPVRSVGGA